LPGECLEHSAKLRKAGSGHNSGLSPRNNETMNVNETRRDGYLIVTPVGRLDSNTSPAFDRHLSGVIARGDTRLVVDLSQVEYISSTGLSAFLSAAKKIKAAGGRLALSHLNSRIRLVFEMSGMLRLFPTYASTDDALLG